MFHHAFELPVTVVRPFNTYGPRQSARAVIPTILAQLARGLAGDPPRLPDAHPGLHLRDGHGRGLPRVAECDRALGEVVNLGAGEEISIGDLARALIKASGRDAEVVVDPARLRPSGSEVQRLLSDNTRAREWAGWKPEVSLHEGLTRTSDWIADHLHLFAPDRYQVCRGGPGAAAPTGYGPRRLRTSRCRSTRSTTSGSAPGSLRAASTSCRAADIISRWMRCRSLSRSTRFA